MPIKIIILSLFLLVFKVDNAQDTTYTRQCVAQLSSEAFHGRGFVKKGDKIAANFIVNELKKWGAKPIGASYFQNFNIDINTITKAKVSIDGKAQVLGEDYLVYAASSSLKGKYQLYQPVKFSVKSFFEKSHNKEVFVFDTIHYKSPDLIEKYESLNKTGMMGKVPAIIEVRSSRLIQTQRTYELKYPVLQFAGDRWDSTATEITIDVKNKFIPNYTTQNVIAYIEGEIDSFYVFTAHYDHLGRVGQDAYFPGANDNASGVATILTLAKMWAESGKKPKYNIAFMLFSAEEAGLLGSEYYVSHPLFSLEKIKFLFNLDMVGTGVEGLSVVNGKEHAKASELIESINAKDSLFSDVRIGKGSANSDHYYFHDKGVPAVFLFTRGGPQFYHDIFDKNATLPLNKVQEIIRLLNLFMEDYE
ncbi:MAG: M20/M25/M40 family metallo-hydrolase [Bacteroidales bacterium]|nr:M20/M25/M40 family metallo-hydrolase [Bacteroidales bacterium]